MPRPALVVTLLVIIGGIGAWLVRPSPHATTPTQPTRTGAHVEDRAVAADPEPVVAQADRLVEDIHQREAAYQADARALAEQTNALRDQQVERVIEAPRPDAQPISSLPPKELASINGPVKS